MSVDIKIKYKLIVVSSVWQDTIIIVYYGRFTPTVYQSWSKRILGGMVRDVGVVVTKLHVIQY